MNVLGGDSIVAVGAHPGDIELMCGAMLMKFAASGARCVAVHVSDGAQGDLSSSPQHYGQQKSREGHAFAEEAGIEVKFLKFPDGYVTNDARLREQLVWILQDIRPRVVITHWRGSFHPDHRAVHAAVHDAALQAALPADGREHQVNLICYGENWEDHEGYSPDVYLDVSTVYEQWNDALQHLAMWRGEVISFRYSQYYRALSRLRGAECGCEFAETLMLSPHKRPSPHPTIPIELGTHVY